MNSAADAAPADFLGRLVERARGAETGVRPRLPSLFEPVFPIGVGMIEDPKRFPPTGNAHEDVSPPPAREQRDIGVRRITPAITAAHDETAPVLGARRHEPAQLAQFDVETAPIAPIGRPFLTRAAFVDGASDTNPARNEMPDAGLRAEQNPARRGSAVSVAQLSPLDARAAASERSAAAAEYLPAENGALLTASMPAMNGTRFDAYAARRPTPEQPRENKAADIASTIHVTIGRVEVRAVQSSAVERRAGVRAPRPMALDEYLKRRGGGR